MKSNSVTILIIAIGDNRGEGGGEGWREGAPYNQLYEDVKP